MNNHSPRSRSGGNGRGARTKASRAEVSASNGKGRSASGSRAAVHAGAGDKQVASGKRERILDAAVRVFAQEGFFNAKVSQIAHVAGVADGTIYLYFKSKDDLLISLFEDRMEQVNATLRQALGSTDDPVARLQHVIELHLQLIESNRHMAEVICVELRQSSKFMKDYANPKFAEFLRLIAGAISDGQKSGALKTDLDPPTVARALFGALDEIALSWLVKGKEKMDLSRAAQQLSHLFIDGLRAR